MSLPEVQRSLKAKRCTGLHMSKITSKLITDGTECQRSIYLPYATENQLVF